jgi:hypothetical protein
MDPAQVLSHKRESALIAPTQATKEVDYVAVWRAGGPLKRGFGLSGTAANVAPSRPPSRPGADIESSALFDLENPG